MAVQKKEPANKKVATKVAPKDETPKFDKDQFATLLEVQMKIDEDRKERAEKLSAHTFDKRLQGASTSITRGERKAFKADNELDVKHYDEFDDEQRETLLDFLLEKREVQDIDDLGEGELLMWVELIVGRTVNPLYFEGK